MTKHQINVALAALLTTLADTGEAPEGTLYAAMMSKYSLDQFNSLVGMLKQAGLVTSAYHLCSITPKGRELAAKIMAAVSA